MHLVGQCGKAHVLLVDILGAGAGQVRCTLGLLSSPMPCPLPSLGKEAAEDQVPRVGNLNGRKGVRTCGQRPEGGKAGQGVVGEGTFALASASSTGTQGYVCECKGRDMRLQQTESMSSLGWWTEGTKIKTLPLFFPLFIKPRPQYSPLPSAPGGSEAPCGPDPAAGVAGCSNSGTGAIYRQQR